MLILCNLDMKWWKSHFTSMIFLFEIHNLWVIIRKYQTNSCKWEYCKMPASAPQKMPRASTTGTGQHTVTAKRSLRRHSLINQKKFQIIKSWFFLLGSYTRASCMLSKYSTITELHPQPKALIFGIFSVFFFF
jgi:hypothetical protein